MSLIRCPDCSHQVSTRAVACPGCGFPISELTTLPEAASKNSLQLVQDVMKAGADVHETDARGRTALMIASRNGNFEIAKTLIDAGAKPDGSGTYGITPLMEAASQGHTRLVQLLLDSNADPLVRNEFGESAIDLARKKRQKSTTLLLQQKILPLIQDSSKPLTTADAPIAADAPTEERIHEPVDSSARLLNEKPKTESYCSDLLCLHCGHVIMPEHLQCPGCKTPIIRRYCRCSRLIPDHAVACPYCSTQKQARFRYIRRMESIVIGSVTVLVLGVLLLSAWSRPEEAHGRDAIQNQVQTKSLPANPKPESSPAGITAQSDTGMQQPVVKRPEPNVSVDLPKSQPGEGLQAQSQMPPNQSDPGDQEQEVRLLRAASHLNDLGYRLMQVGRYDEAVQILERALETFPPGRTRNIAYAWTLYNLGRSLRLAGHPDLAIPVLEKRMNYTDQRETVARELQEAKREAGDVVFQSY